MCVCVSAGVRMHWVAVKYSTCILTIFSSSNSSKETSSNTSPINESTAYNNHDILYIIYTYMYTYTYMHEQVIMIQAAKYMMYKPLFSVFHPLENQSKEHNNYESIIKDTYLQLIIYSAPPTHPL